VHVHLWSRLPSEASTTASILQDARVEEDFYSVDEAAKILKLTPGRIRQMPRAGELEGLSPEEGGE
jgi:hypothetical protein